MAIGTEISRLVVRLLGDAKGYVHMVSQAGKVTDKFSRDAQGRLRDAQGRFVTGLRAMGYELGQAMKPVDRLRIRLRYLGEALGKVAGRMRNVGQRMSAMGRSMAMRVTAPVVAIGLASVKAFASFDQAMTESTSIMKVTEAQIAAMRQQALRLAGTGELVHAPTELAKAYFYLASAGKNAEQSMALLPAVGRFATAGAFNLAEATDLLTDAQSALGLTMENAAADALGMARVSDVLVRANTLANASVRQFSVALTSKAGAALKAFNKDIEEGVAVLAAMADQGIKAELAGNNLSRIMLLLSKAEIDSKKALEKYNFQVFDATGKMRNFADIIENLEQSLAGMSDEQKAIALDAMGFQARVQATILPLLGTSKAIRRYERELRKAGGTTRAVAEKQMKSFANQMKTLWNQIKVLGIELGEKLTPSIKALGEYVKKAIKWFSALSPEAQRTAVKIALISAAIGPLLIILGSAIRVIGGVALAVKGLTTALIFLTAHPIIAGLTVLAAAIAWVALEIKKVGDVKAEGLQIAARFAEQGKKHQESALGEMKVLGDLAAKQKLSNEEMDKAQSIINGLTGYYGPLSVEVDRATGKIVGYTKGMNEARESMIRLRRVQLTAQLQELNLQFAEAARKSQSWWRTVGTQEYWSEQMNILSTKVLAVTTELGNLNKTVVKPPAVKDAGAAPAAKVWWDAFDRIKESATRTFDHIGRVAKHVGKGLANNARIAWRIWLKNAKAVQKAWKDARRRGKELTEQFRTPAEVFKDTRAELDKLLKALGPKFLKTYQRAMKAARDKLAGVTVTVPFEFKEITTVRYGSSAAFAEMAKHRAMLARGSAGAKVAGPLGGVAGAKAGAAGTVAHNVGRGVAAGTSKLAELLLKLVEIAEEQLDKPRMEVAPAEFD